MPDRLARGLLCLVFLLFTFWLAAAPCLSSEDTTTTPDSTADGNTAAEATEPRQKTPPAPINFNRPNLQVHRLRQGIKEHKEKIKITQEKEKSLLDELAQIDRNLLIHGTKLAILKESYAHQEKIVEQEQARLDMAIAEKKTQQHFVQNRLTAYYQMGGIGLMNVVFSKKNLTDLLNFEEYFHHLLEYDRLAIASYQEKVTKLTRVREKQEQEKNRLQELVTKVETNEGVLATIQQEKMTLLSRVKTEERLYQQAVAEIEKAAESLAAALERRQAQKEKTPVLLPQSAKKKLRSPDRKQNQDNQEVQEADQAPVDKESFLAQKGKLPPPVDGIPVGNSLEPSGDSEGAGLQRRGIDFMVAKGMDIIAVYGGTVITAGYLRGYGNMLIIDHGQHYYTIVSQAGEILKEEGSTVQQGEVIGITGDSHTLLSEGLHFEIRHGSIPEDPLQWLNKETIKTAP